MQRRSFVRILGGGIVLAAGAGTLAGCSVFEVPPSAIAAWQGPPPEMDLRRFVLSYALLAPNPHNMQPWLADLGTAGEITLRLDTQRLLPVTDPYGRQILMGAGAFLELLAMAAAERGHRAEVVLFPEGEPGQRLDGKAFAKLRLVAEPAWRATRCSRRSWRGAPTGAPTIPPAGSPRPMPSVCARPSERCRFASAWPAARTRQPETPRAWLPSAPSRATPGASR